MIVLKVSYLQLSVSLCKSNLYVFIILGVDFKVKLVTVPDGTKIKLSIWVSDLIFLPQTFTYIDL